MDRNKKEWLLSEHNVNLSRLDTFKVTPYREGIVVCGNKIEERGLLELIFDKQDLDIEKFVFEEIHISSLQIDDTLKVCIDVDKSLEKFQNENNELLKTQTIEHIKKFKSVIEQYKKHDEYLKRLVPFSTELQDIAKQMELPKEALKFPSLADSLGNLKLDYSKYLQSQEKTPYLFCFEKCMLEEVDFAKKVRHNLEFKDNIFLKYCQILNKTFFEKVEFLDNVFEQFVSIKESKFKKSLSFKTHKDTKEWNLIFSHSDFEGEVFIIGNKLEQVKIENSTFYENVYFGLDHSKSPNGECGSSKINQNFILQDIIFMKKAYFERCDFQFCVIEGCKFQDDAFFDHSSFDEIRIFKTIFEQRTSFYHATFYQPPLFVNCVFDKHLTMTGLKLGLNNTEFIEKMRKNAINLCDTHNNQRAGTFSKPNDRYEPDDFLKDYRDGFCTIKNALIKNNNLLDASNYHRTELYCKELELDSKTQKTLRDRIDLLQLWFYRLTSDHHTDLAMIFNNVIILIALFGIFALCLNEIKIALPINEGVPIQFSNEGVKNWQWGIFQPLASKIDMGAIFTTFSLLGIFLVLHIIEKIFNLKEKKMRNILKMFRYLIIGVPFVCIGVYTSLYLSSFSPPWFEAYTIILICSNFILAYLGLILNRGYALTLLSYGICLGILVFKPLLLLPFVGQLFDEGLKTNFPAMQSLSVVYCILMVLMIFSLQKTARKNSIVPS